MSNRTRWTVRGVILATILFAAVAVYPFLRGDMETLTLDDAARGAMPGRSFIQLSDGCTHYEWAGPQNGPPVVLVHGMTAAMFIWDYQFEALAKEGFRVVRYDLYGRGYSDRPNVPYDENLFDRQLLELLDALKLTQPVDVVGLSMGGAVTVRFLDRHPERVRRFVLFAPAGFTVYVPWKYYVMHWPGAGEWIMKAFGDQYLGAGVTRHMQLDPDQEIDFTRQYLDPMRYKGHKRALLSTLRHMPMLTLQPLYESAGKKGRKGLLFWGTADHVVTFSNSERVKAAMPDIEFCAVEGCGHTLNYEKPADVNKRLIEFLRQSPQPGLMPAPAELPSQQ